MTIGFSWMLNLSISVFFILPFLYLKVDEVCQITYYGPSADHPPPLRLTHVDIIRVTYENHRFITWKNV